jgi:hypothetical protein
VSTIYTEDSDSWIDIGKPIKWVSLSTTHTVGNNNYFLLLSERNGWRQILLVGNNNGEADSELSSTHRFIEVTPVGFDVESICGFDDVSKVVYFIASPVDPLRRYLYSASLSTLNTPDLTDDVQFPVQRVTPTDESFSGMCFTVIPLALYTALMLYHVILYIMS